MIAASRAELAGHLTVVSVAFICMAVGGYRFSLQFETGGEWQGNAPGLRTGWLLGRSMDLSDIQWRNFRGAFAALIAGMATFLAISHLHRRLQPRSGTSPVKSRSGDSGTSLLHSTLLNSRAGRPAMYLAFAALFIGHLHGVTAVFPVALSVLNFYLARRVAGVRFGGAVIWAFCFAALLSARVCNGFMFSSMSRWLGFLDGHRGAVRWEVCFNLSLLRMLSFGLDLHWRQLRVAQQAQQGVELNGHHSSRGSSISRSSSMQSVREQSPQGARRPASGMPPEGGTTLSPSGKAQHGNGALQHAEHAVHPPQRLTARQRQQQGLPSWSDYDMVTYLAYVFYPPLYLAGPIITFQDFAWQLRQPAAIRHDQLVRYGCRFAADWLCLEVLTHTLYFNSVAKYGLGVKYGERGMRYGFFEIALTGFWVLCFMWLKFATIWRFFRLVALLDGIEPPENMKRCFANNYDIEGFWKGWHSSYNAWLVRYMYIPMGGSRWRLLNIWPIFMFVALWHDLERRLLAWAWLVCLAFMPELLIKRAAASSRAAPWVDTPSYRHAAAALAALNITALMAVNLTGFVMGWNGLRLLAVQLLRQPLPLALALGVFFSAAQLMFWIREREAPPPPAPVAAPA